MSFWRKGVIDFALDRETAAHIREQKEWIAREPHNPRPWYNLAQLYRMEQKQRCGTAAPARDGVGCMPCRRL